MGQSLQCSLLMAGCQADWPDSWTSCFVLFLAFPEPAHNFYSAFNSLVHYCPNSPFRPFRVSDLASVTSFLTCHRVGRPLPGPWPSILCLWDTRLSIPAFITITVQLAKRKIRARLIFSGVDLEGFRVINWWHLGSKVAWCISLYQPIYSVWRPCKRSAQSAPRAAPADSWTKEREEY